MSVLVGHTLHQHLLELSADTGQHVTLRLLVDILLPFVQYGGTGVVVFFLVSGYVITSVLRTEDPAEFVVKRFFRIYPLYMFAFLSQLAVLFVAKRTPTFPTLLMQLSLLGDLTQTPYTLGGVEWTLRIEIMFYAFMGMLAWARKAFPRFSGRYQYLPYLAIVIALAILPPFTSGAIGWGQWSSKGVVTLYFPFLLIGSLIFLNQEGQVRTSVLSGFCAIVFAQFFWLTPDYQPRWNDHHAVLALAVFLLAWFFRHRLRTTSWVTFLSAFTYSVYLFHNWVYWIFQAVLAERLGMSVPMSIALSMLLLFGVCYGAMQLIEKPGIALGKRLSMKFHKTGR